MLVFRHATDVTVTVPFEDSTGASVAPVSASYTVFNQDRVEVVASTDLTIVAGDVSATITVLAANNTLNAGVMRGARVVEVTMIDVDGNTRVASIIYAIETTEALEILVNSYQTAETAELTAMDIPELVGWSAASKDERRAALVEAYHHLGTLTYMVGYQNDKSRIMTGTWTIRYLNDLTLQQFKDLPEVFRKALGRAQVIEADAILGGDPLGEQRRSGLLSHTVGESSQMYRSGKPLVLNVSARALRALTGFVTFNPGVGYEW